VKYLLDTNACIGLLNGRAPKLSAWMCAYLESTGKPIGANDLLIAAIALANDLTLVTRNVGEFSRVL
jgi:tRNA(fMet)-specific endonuclease VapC